MKVLIIATGILLTSASYAASLKTESVSYSCIFTAKKKPTQYFEGKLELNGKRLASRPTEAGAGVLTTHAGIVRAYLLRSPNRLRSVSLKLQTEKQYQKGITFVPGTQTTEPGNLFGMKLSLLKRKGSATTEHKLKKKWRIRPTGTLKCEFSM